MLNIRLASKFWDDHHNNAAKMLLSFAKVVCMGLTAQTSLF